MNSFFCLVAKLNFKLNVKFGKAYHVPGRGGSSSSWTEPQHQPQQHQQQQQPSQQMHLLPAPPPPPPKPYNRLLQPTQPAEPPPAQMQQHQAWQSSQQHEQTTASGDGQQWSPVSVEGHNDGQWYDDGYSADHQWGQHDTEHHEYQQQNDQQHPAVNPLEAEQATPVRPKTTPIPKEPPQAYWDQKAKHQQDKPAEEQQIKSAENTQLELTQMEADLMRREDELNVQKDIFDREKRKFETQKKKWEEDFEIVLLDNKALSQKVERLEQEKLETAQKFEEAQPALPKQNTPCKLGQAFKIVI